MLIRPANYNDIAVILKHDKWVTREIINQKIDNKQIYLALDGDKFIGWLRFGLFWDNTPYINMLHLIEDYREKGIGKELVEYWENEMKKAGHKVVLTSTAQAETAQHFYVKLGYKAIGSFTLANEPLEIIFSKFI